MDAYIGVSADVYIEPKIQFGIALTIPKLFSKSYQLALVDKPGLSFDSDVAATLEAGSGDPGGSVGTDKCPGVELELGFFNSAYLNVSDLKTVSINSYTKTLYSKCITRVSIVLRHLRCKLFRADFGLDRLAKGTRTPITTVGGISAFGAHARQSGSDGDSDPVTVTTTVYVTTSARSAAPKPSLSTNIPKLTTTSRRASTTKDLRA